MVGKTPKPLLFLFFFGREQEREWERRTGKRIRYYGISEMEITDREHINYGREHDTCNHFKHLARHHVYITVTHHQVNNTVQAAQVRNKEKNTTWAARQQQPVADSGGRRSTPVAWISDLAPRRRHCLPLLSPRRWIPGHRGGGGLATFGMEGLGDFRSSEVGGDADLG